MAIWWRSPRSRLVTGTTKTTACGSDRWRGPETMTAGRPPRLLPLRRLPRLTDRLIVKAGQPQLTRQGPLESELLQAAWVAPEPRAAVALGVHRSAGGGHGHDAAVIVSMNPAPLGEAVGPDNVVAGDRHAGDADAGDRSLEVEVNVAIEAGDRPVGLAPQEAVGRRGRVERRDGAGRRNHRGGRAAAGRDVQDVVSRGVVEPGSCESEVRECPAGDKCLDGTAVNRHLADSARIGPVEGRPVGYQIAGADGRRRGGEHDGSTASERYPLDLRLLMQRVVGDEIAVPGASYAGVGDRLEVDWRSERARFLVQDSLLAGLVGLRGAVDDGLRCSREGLGSYSLGGPGCYYLGGLGGCPVEVAGGLEQTVGVRVGQRGRGPGPPAPEVDEVIRPGLSPRGVCFIQYLRPAEVAGVGVPVVLRYDDVAVVRPDGLDDGDMPVGPDDAVIVVRVPLRYRSHGRGLVDRKAVFPGAGRPVRCVNRQGGTRGRDTVDRLFDVGRVVGAVGSHAVRRRVLDGGTVPVRLNPYVLVVVGCIRDDAARVQLSGYGVAAPALTQRPRVGGRRRRGRGERAPRDRGGRSRRESVQGRVFDGVLAAGQRDHHQGS